MENIFNEIDNRLYIFDKLKTDIKDLLSKIKLINKNNSIYNNDEKNNYKEYYIIYLEKINKILENNKIKLIDLIPSENNIFKNEIICIYDIEKGMKDIFTKKKDNYLNNQIRILNSYEDTKREHPKWDFEGTNPNEKEIKESELYLNNNKINFCYIQLISYLNNY